MALYMQYLIKYKVERSNVIKREQEEEERRLKEEKEREMSKPGILRFAEHLRRENERIHKNTSVNDDVSGLDLLHYLRDQRIKARIKEEELKQQIAEVERKLPSSFTKAQKTILIKEKLGLEDLGSYEDNAEEDPFLETLFKTKMDEDFSDNFRITKMLMSKIKERDDKSGKGFEEKCLDLFLKYSSADDPNVINLEGLRRLIRDMRILEKSEPVKDLINGWRDIAKDKKYLSREDWMMGMNYLKEDINFILRTMKDRVKELEGPDDFSRFFTLDATQLFQEHELQSINAMELLWIIYSECFLFKDLLENLKKSKRFCQVTTTLSGAISGDGSINPDLLERLSSMIFQPKED